MWKVALLLFVATFGSIAAQDTIEINCTFQWTIFNEYVCVLNGIEVTDPEATVVIGGNHVGENDNSNVEVVQVRNSNTPFMIQEIFAAFPNMIELDIEQSGLQSINVPDSVQLVWLILYRNNISRIEDNGLLNQTELYYLELIGNGIEFVGENAFAGLDRLEALVLINNNIAEIAPTTFHSLPAVTYLDMERNALTSINAEIFSRSLRLYSIYLEYNQINEIEAGFLSDIVNNLRFINLVGNVCVNRSFPLQDDNGWMAMHNALQNCYNNFNGTVPETRRITLEFTGNLSLFDEFGNIIARI